MYIKIVNFAAIMANPIKQLAGETAIYGLSTILARIINFIFVPIYTRVLTTASYGVLTEFMAYIAVLQVVLVLGLETGCFKFANKEGVEPKAVYSNALAAVFGVNALFLAAMIVFATPLADALGYHGYENCIIYTGGILFLDSITAILFAKLRQERKAFRFAIFKTVKILTETASNLVLFFVLPSYCAGLAASLGKPVQELSPADAWILDLVPAVPDFSYAILAIFISCIVCALLFVPEFFRMTCRFDRKLLHQMLLYSLPLMVAALPGIVNDFLDRILFRYFDTGAENWRSSLGVFQAATKLAVIMSLFIQMFRFAAEPFFFQRAKDRNSKELYAQVMEYFTAFCGLIFLGVILYIDIISLILGPEFRQGVGVVPVMMLSYMLLGILFNVSMWYKLSGKTGVAIYITLAGLAVTTVVNIVFMPEYSYWASAFGHLASYMVMLLISVWLGRKYYPIPYRWGRILSFFVLMGLIYGASLLLDSSLFPENGSGMSGGTLAVKLTLHTVLIIFYAAVSWIMLRRRQDVGIPEETETDE